MAELKPSLSGARALLKPPTASASSRGNGYTERPRSFLFQGNPLEAFKVVGP
jgi:hypothetical protein